MYKYLLVATVVLTSGCLGFGGLLQQFSLNHEEVVSFVEDISVSAESVPSQITEENSGTLFISVENGGESTVENLTVRVTDPCILSFENSSFEVGQMEPLQVEEIAFEFTAGTTLVDNDCRVRYSVSYDSQASSSIDFSAVSEDEYARLSRGDEEPSVRLFYDRSDTPVAISMSFSKGQPLQSGDDFFFQMQLSNDGVGEVESVSTEDLSLVYPDGLAVLSSEGCDDLVPGEENGTLRLVRDLRFSRGETKALTCKMEAGEVGILEKGKFTSTVDYRYAIRESVTVRVVPE